MKKSIILTFLLLASVFMFAEEFTIVSFNINHNNLNERKKETLLNAISYVVKKNNADIILLQEVKIKWNKDEKKVNDYFISRLRKDTSTDWTCYTTINKAKKDCDEGQHNVVLVRNTRFKTINYLSDKNKKSDLEINYECPSRFNNVQVMKFTTKTNKEFIVINAHITPKKAFQNDDFKSLKEYMVTRFDKKIPLVLGGDLNYTTEKLRGGIDGVKFDGNWIIDGPIYEVPNSNPWVTSIGLNPWDHFIFNKEFKSIIAPKTAKGFEGKYGMRHALYIDDKRGAEVGDNIYLSLGKDGQYYKQVSDHFPICITIETK